MENQTKKFYSIFSLFFCRFNHSADRRSENKAKMSYLMIAFDRYASIGTVLHGLLV